MSEPAWNTKDKREKLMEIMFEKFDIPGMFQPTRELNQDKIVFLIFSLIMNIYFAKIRL